MKNILVVDDQPNIRRLIEICLDSGDRQILGAESGESAIDIAQREPLDLIILDVVMPGGMNGFKALELLKKDPKTRDCPVLMLTARTEQSDRERAFEFGARDYIAKPFKIQMLQKVVEEILA